MSRGGKVYARLGLLTLSLVISALFLEAGVLLSVGEQAKYPRHVVGTDFGVRVNEPGAHYRHKSADGTVWFRINSRGLRADRDYPYEKPDGVVRIVSLGDSFTAGYEVGQDATFSSVLEQSLALRGHSVEVLNAGVSGYSNAEACLYLERELLRYEPDIVLVSFYGNDIVDNVRTGLFGLRDGKLEQIANRYVPGGEAGNFLNTNPMFNWLSGYSNAFVFFKERLTHLTKRQMIRDNVANVKHVETSEGAAETREAAAQMREPRQLTAQIFERIYRSTRKRRIPLVIQSIPHWSRQGRTELTEMFPLEFFDVKRNGIHFFSALNVLQPSLGVEALYHSRSHGHWTPFSHRKSGEALATLIAEQGLLGGDASNWPVAAESSPHR